MDVSVHGVNVGVYANTIANYTEEDENDPPISLFPWRSDDSSASDDDGRDDVDVGSSRAVLATISNVSKASSSASSKANTTVSKAPSRSIIDTIPEASTPTNVADATSPQSIQPVSVSYTHLRAHET